MMQLDNARRVLKTFSSHLGEQADTTYADTQLIAQSNTSSFEDRRRKNTGAVLRRRIPLQRSRISN